MRQLFLAIVFALCAAAPVAAQDPATSGSDAEHLAKQLNNPVANLVSVPLQFNWEEGVGDNDELRTVMNFQPVVPFALSKDWNVIGRMILPYLSQPALTPGGPSESGVSDMLLSAFFSPVGSHRVTWGVGPAVSLPMTTDPVLGSGKWSAGPTAVLVMHGGPWTYGALVNHLWSFADTGDLPRTDVDQTFLQPFVAYTTKSAWTIGVNSESTANWEAPSGDEWTVPINVSFSKVTRLGPFPFSLGVGAGVFVERPPGGPDWKLRITTTLILPSAH